MGAATNSDAEITRVLLLSIAGHLRCFSDQPVAEIVQATFELPIGLSASVSYTIGICASPAATILSDGKT